jgi:hypothetical protein
MKNSKQVTLTSFELFILNGLMPFVKPYGKLDLIEAMGKHRDVLSEADLRVYEETFIVSNEANIIFYLLANGYVEEKQIVTKYPVIYGELILEGSKCTNHFEFTDKGRALWYGAKYETLKQQKVFYFSFRLKFRRKLFYKRHLKQRIEFIKSYLKLKSWK